MSCSRQKGSSEGVWCDVLACPARASFTPCLVRCAANCPCKDDSRIRAFFPPWGITDGSKKERPGGSGHESGRHSGTEAGSRVRPPGRSPSALRLKLCEKIMLPGFLVGKYVRRCFHAIRPEHALASLWTVRRTETVFRPVRRCWRLYVRICRTNHAQISASKFYRTVTAQDQDCRTESHNKFCL